MRFIHTNLRLSFVLLSAVVAPLLTTGCASHKFVRSEDQTTRTQVGEVMDEVEKVQSDVSDLQDTVGEQGEAIDGLSTTTQEALDRAIAAGKLAEGKFVYETELSDDKVHFGLEQSSLSDEARQELDAFAADLQQRDENLYIEIQGHTDASGAESYNLILGEERADAVKRYLSLQHHLPLHRMATISYGESAPVADNSTREGRALNRRVTLVVLK